MMRDEYFNEIAGFIEREILIPVSTSDRFVCELIEDWENSSQKFNIDCDIIYSV